MINKVTNSGTPVYRPFSDIEDEDQFECGRFLGIKYEIEEDNAISYTDGSCVYDQDDLCALCDTEDSHNI